MAQRHPGVHFTVADLGPVCDVAEQYIDQYGMREQVDALKINMFRDQWPSGHDAIFFSSVLHDWDKRHQAELNEATLLITADHFGLRLAGDRGHARRS